MRNLHSRWKTAAERREFLRRLSGVSPATRRNRQEQRNKHLLELRARRLVQEARQHLQQAVDSPSLNRLEKAMQLLEDAKSTSPEVFSGEGIHLWEDLALAFCRAGSVDKAAYCLRRQAELQPGKSDAFLNLGVLYYSVGRLLEAVGAYLEGLESTPADPYLSHNLRELLRAVGGTKALEDMLNAVIVDDPDRDECFWIRGVIRRMQGNHTAAITNFRHALCLARLHGSGVEKRAAAALGKSYALVARLGDPNWRPYTRSQALQDGAIVDVTEWARAHGFRYPVAMTARLWQWLLPVGTMTAHGGRLDILFGILRAAPTIVGRHSSTVSFDFVTETGHGVPVAGVCHSGDEEEPVITLMVQSEYDQSVIRVN